MAIFPKWVDRDFEVDGDIEALASRRLRYLVLHTSVMTNCSGSIMSFADFCGIQRTEVHAAIRLGKFSATMAKKIENACGRDVIRREWLVFPLDIEEMVTA